MADENETTIYEHRFNNRCSFGRHCSITHYTIQSTASSFEIIALVLKPTATKGNVAPRILYGDTYAASISRVETGHFESIILLGLLHTHASLLHL